MASLRPGTRSTRYGRTWRMAQYRRSDGVVAGRIGFEAGSAVERWNEELQDFHPTQMLEGHTSPFAIDLNTLRLVFQLRPGIIKPLTFTENFRALLEAASEYRWRVDPEPDLNARAWDEWLAEVERVTEVHVTMLRPNPHYSFGDIEQLIEGAHARSLEVIARASREQVEGLKVDEGWLADALSHARDYGKYSAKGQTRDGTKMEWKEGEQGQPKRITTDVDPVTSEVSTERLIGELHDDDAQDRR